MMPLGLIVHVVLINSLVVLLRVQLSGMCTSFAGQRKSCFCGADRCVGVGQTSKQVGASDQFVPH